MLGVTTPVVPVRPISVRPLLCSNSFYARIDPGDGSTILLDETAGLWLPGSGPVIVAYDAVAFPHQMISDYVATKPGAAVANWAWPLFILSHALFEARLFHLIKQHEAKRSHQSDASIANQHHEKRRAGAKLSQ